MNKFLKDNLVNLSDNLFYKTLRKKDIKINGKRNVISVKIDENMELNKDDKEILEDMIMIATNDALKKIDKEIEMKLGSQTGGLSGLF